jgi:hypothetical protein
MFVGWYTGCDMMEMRYVLPLGPTYDGYGKGSDHFGILSKQSLLISVGDCFQDLEMLIS